MSRHFNSCKVNSLGPWDHNDRIVHIMVLWGPQANSVYKHSVYKHSVYKHNVFIYVFINKHINKNTDRSCGGMASSLHNEIQ